MGRDNQPRERQARQLARKSGKRTTYDRILIVCEGRKTEPLYFTDLRQSFRLQTASVEIQHSDLGTSPIQVVQYAQHIFENGHPQKFISPRAFEQVYAVFDRDEHQSYFDALQAAQALNGRLRNDAKVPIRFEAVPSIPNFELWLLLHFADVVPDHALHRHETIQRLRLHMPTYQKAQHGVFSMTQTRLEEAWVRSRILSSANEVQNGTLPCSDVGELVRTLTLLAV